MNAVGVWALVSLSALLLGGAALKGSGLKLQSWAEAFLFSSLVGLGGLAYLVLGLGLLGLLAPLAAWALILASGLVGLVVVRLPSSVSRPPSSVLRPPLSPHEIALSAALLLQVGLNFLAALAPPTGTDALVYHLAVPKLYALHGRIDFIAGNYYANQPFTVQMLYLLALLLGSDSAAQLLHFGFGLLASLGVWLLAYPTLGRRAALIAVVLFYSITDVAVASSVALVDLGSAAFFVGACVALLRWLENKELPWLITSGLMAGLMAGTRLSNALLAAGLGLALGLWLLWRERSALHAAASRVLLFGLVALVVAAPWYGRSWLMAGNPFYPFAYELFGGRDLQPEQAALIFQAQYFDIGDRYSPVDFLASPWIVTFAPEVIHSGKIGPLYLGLLPLLFLAPLPTSARFLLLVAAIELPLWFWGYQRVRSLLPVLAVLSAPTAAALTGLMSRPERGLRLLGGASLAAWLAVALVANARFHLPTVPAGLGLELRETYLVRVLDSAGEGAAWYADLREFSGVLPQGSRAMLWDTRGYYLEADYLWATALSQRLSPSEAGDPEVLVQQARRLGVTHLILPLQPLRNPTLEQLRSTILQSPRVRLAAPGQRVALFELGE